MKLAFFLFLAFLTANSAIAQQLDGLPFTTTYTTHNYGGGIQNLAITQNNEGLIYVANNFGILEFDGTNWSRYPLPTSTKTRDVMVGKDGRIYIASQGDFGYFIPNSQQGFQFISLADSLPDEYRNFDEAWKIFEDGKQIVFCTFRQIFIFQDNKLLKVIDPVSPPENFYFVNHILYVNQIDIGLAYLDQDTLKLFNKGDFFQGKTITGIIPLGGDKLWITTLNHGVFLYNGVDYQTLNTANNPHFIDAGINQILRMSNGNIAIGTQNNGLYIVNKQGDILQHLNKGKGLNNRTILAIHEDVLGNLWLGHNNGITNVELNLPFSVINEESNLPGTGYDAYLAEQKLFLGTSNGLYFKASNNAIEDDYKFIEQTEGQVYSIQQVSNHVLVGHHKGALELKENQIYSLSDLLGYWTFFQLKDHPNYLIAGTYKGLVLFKQTNQGLQFIRKIKGFSESSRVMAQGDNGDIWMTHGYKGVFRLKLNELLDSVSVSFYGTEKGLPSQLLINVWQIDSRLVFTTESEVYTYQETSDSFVKDEFFVQHFKPNTQISFLEQDALGNIYFLARDEMGILEKRPNGVYEKKVQVFNRLKGLLNDDLQNLSVLNTNYVIYGAKEGFVIYNKSADRMKEMPYQTLIRKVSLTLPIDSLISTGYFIENGKISIKQSNTPLIDYDNNSIRFEFSAPFFHGHQTEYQYSLNGFEKEWSVWTTKMDKEYTNLSEGKYTFKVRARNIYQHISEEAIFRFEISPPWYRSIFAYAVYAILVICFLLCAYYFLSIKHKQEKKFMVLKQEKAMNTIGRELRSSEEEVQRLRNEKLEAEVVSKNKELTLSTMHLLNKNSFINSMKHDINTVIKRSKNQEVKKELLKIINSINKNIEGDEDWSHFAMHFDQVHGDFTKRLRDGFPNLTPQEMKLSAYLRMNLSTKEIAHLLNISVRGVEIARYRLRKKLELERSVNLQEFILKY